MKALLMVFWIPLWAIVGIFHALRVILWIAIAALAMILLCLTWIMKQANCLFMT